MASGKEIRQQIGSVKNTQKITKAMEMVAAAKMRRSQDRMNATRPYIDKVRLVIDDLSQSHPEYQHPFTVVRPVKNVGIIVISTDRGLCGGLNANAFRKTIRYVESLRADDIGIKFCTIGSKAQNFLKVVGGEVTSAVTQLGDTPHLDQIIGSINAMISAFEAGEIDRLVMVNSIFENSMTQSPNVTQIFPTQIESTPNPKIWDYIYEPDAKVVLDGLLRRYAESLVYQAVVENVACEMSARMIAMKSATDNAGDMIHQLNLAYNKARQAAITQELSEIIGGASAV